MSTSGLHIHVHTCASAYKRAHTYTQKKFILLWQGHASFSFGWHWAPKHSAQGPSQNLWRTFHIQAGWLSRAFLRLSSDTTALRANSDLKKNDNGFWNRENQCLLYWGVSRKKAKDRNGTSNFTHQSINPRLVPDPHGLQQWTHTGSLSVIIAYNEMLALVSFQETTFVQDRRGCTESKTVLLLCWENGTTHAFNILGKSLGPRRD